MNIHHRLPRTNVVVRTLFSVRRTKTFWRSECYVLYAKADDLLNRRDEILETSKAENVKTTEKTQTEQPVETATTTKAESEIETATEVESEAKTESESETPEK